MTSLHLQIKETATYLLHRSRFDLTRSGVRSPALGTFWIVTISFLRILAQQNIKSTQTFRITAYTDNPTAHIDTKSSAVYKNLQFVLIKSYSPLIFQTKMSKPLRRAQPAFRAARRKGLQLFIWNIKGE